MELREILALKSDVIHNIAPTDLVAVLPDSTPAAAITVGAAQIAPI